MTWPVTPDPGIHDDTKSVKQQSFFSEQQILTWAEQLPLAMIKDFADAILAALGLGGVVPTANNIITDVYNALLDIPQGNVSGLAASLEDIGSQIGQLLVSILKSFGVPIPSGASVPDLLGLVTSTLQNIGTEAESILLQIPIISTILQLLGLGGSSTSGGSGGAGSTDSGSGSSAAPLTLAQLLGLLDTTTAISPSQLSALATTASKNLLTDPSFNSGSVIQGNGQWCWDGWIGTGAFGGVNSSIRTVRPGLITIYNIVGTSQGTYMFGNEPIGTGGSGVILEYLRTDLEGWLGTAVDWALTGTDQTYFEWINVPYPAASYPMGPSVQAGHDWLVNAINQIPGPFFFVMDSQGNQVGAAVYDELRYGSLQSRNNDFLGALALGNLRREEGHYFPGCPDLAPGTSGMCPVALMTTGPYAGGNKPSNPKIGNLINTEDRWWDFAVPGDYFACTPLTGNTVDPGPDAIGGNVGDIAGISGLTLRTFYAFVNYNNANASVIQNWLTWAATHGDGLSIIGDFLGAPMNQINALGGADSPHQSYYKDTRPLASKGDNRTFLEIGSDYLNSFVGGVHPDGTPIAPPPVDGVRHQYALQRFAVQPYQVVTAGASVMWINIPPDSGDAVIVCVNAYDSDGNLIATVTADECVISDPASSSNWVFNPLKADFVMPAEAASACLVLDVEPVAMTTGIVWFDDLIFEVDNLIDGSMINSATLSQISGAQVSGPQGEADILTAWQNLIDQLASSHSQTSITGTSLAQMLQSVGQTALNTELAYQLGVANQQILGNVSTQPFWSGMQPTGQVTFPLPTGTLPTASVTAGTALGGFINTSPAITVGFVEFMAKASGTPTSVYLNAYLVDASTGDMTNVWASADLSSQISTSSFSWVAVEISSPQPSFSLSQWAYWEIVSQDVTVSVVAETVATPNKTYQIPPNVGASRTTSTSGGVSPTSLVPAQMSYGGAAPFICMSVTDVAPTYQPPNMKPFTSGAGVYTYNIPSWAQVSGSTFDLVGIGGGGAGGHATGNAGSSILGLTLVPPTVRYGQGGMPGQWATKTITYGTDIPLGTTSLTVINGAGGCAPCGSGATTMIGTGFTTTPQFDAIGAGGSAHGTTLSWTHTATAGAYVVVALSTEWETFNVTYGGTTMIPLGAVDDGNTITNGIYGAVALYGMPNAPAGASTVTVTLPRSVYFTGNSISFTNCSGAGPVTNVSGKGTALSQQVACGANQTIVQAFGAFSAQMGTFNGGTNCYASSYPATRGSGGKIVYPAGLSISYASGTATFGAQTNVVDEWGAVAVALQPAGAVLLSASGGQGGGSGASSNWNPANTNQTATGKGAPNQTWTGRNYAGSSDTTTSHLPGNPWGGGSASGDLSYAAANGGEGASWIVATQPSTVSTGGIGVGIGGGSELSVDYETTGTGGENATGASLTWQHTSDGGPNAAAVLIGAVAYSSGAALPVATYGSMSFNQDLGGVTYYNQSGFAIYIFALGIIGIPSGTQTITLGATGATINDLAGNTMSYNNVGTFGNFYSNTGIGTNLSLPNIPSGAGQMVVGGLANVGRTLSGFNQTQRWLQNVTSSIPMAVGDAVGAPSVSFSVTGAASNYWGAVGGVLLPSS